MARTRDAAPSSYSPGRLLSRRGYTKHLPPHRLNNRIDSLGAAAQHLG
jgi:hypothetical protein